jgi:hypothetical protein
VDRFLPARPSSPGCSGGLFVDLAIGGLVFDQCAADRDHASTSLAVLKQRRAPDRWPSIIPALCSVKLGSVFPVCAHRAGQLRSGSPVIYSDDGLLVCSLIAFLWRERVAAQQPMVLPTSSP